VRSADTWRVVRYEEVVFRRTVARGERIFFPLPCPRRQQRQAGGQRRLCVPCLAGSWAQPPLFKTQSFFTQRANKSATTISANVEALKAVLTEAPQLRYAGGVLECF